MDSVKWLGTRKEALEAIKGGTRLLLTMYYSPECASSSRTFERTLVDEKAVEALEAHFAPVKVNILEAADEAKKNRIEWTPTFVVSDDNGQELERWVGYLPANEFIAQLLVTKGVADFDMGRYDDAKTILEDLVIFHGDSEHVPQAQYYLGAASIKKTGEPDTMIGVCHTLNNTHPDSIWTKKCAVWAGIDLRGPFTGYNAGGSVGSGAY